MGNILPGVIGNVKCRQVGAIQMFLPNTLPAVNDPIGWQAVYLYLWVNFKDFLQQNVRKRLNTDST